MATWLVSVLLLVVSGVQVLANSDVTFPETFHGINSRIVSGWEAQEGQIPHQFSLRMVSAAGQVFSCGGSIISEEWGITAAHCTAARVTMVVRAGVVNLTTPLYIFETTKYYNHPLYDESIPGVVQHHDIGLLEFGIKLTFSEYIKPIRLQNSLDKNRNYIGQVLTASGWGRTWTGGSAPEIMNWVYLLGDSNSFCSMFYPQIVIDSTICASSYNVSSQSTCQGDSGGPLTVVDNDGELTLVGVTSFVSSLGCHAGRPAGFIRPGHYHAWFTKISGINFDWLPGLPSTLPPTTESPETETTTVIVTETEEPSTEGTDTEAPTTVTVDDTDEPTTATVGDTDEPATITVDDNEESTTAVVEDTEATITVDDIQEPTTISQYTEETEI